MKLSRQSRRIRAAKPPIGAATAYAKLLRLWFRARQAKLASEILGYWEHHIMRGRIRHDAKRVPPIQVETSASAIDTIAKRVAKKNAQEMQRVIGIPTKSVAEHTTIEGFRQKNLDLITSLADDEIARLQELLEDADQGAWRVGDLQSKIVEEFGITERHADLIARDQVLKLNGQLTEQRQTSAGISEYIWTTSGDERVRSTHEELDGERFAWDDPPVTNDAGDRNNPGGDYQCRCTATPVIPGLEDEDE